ncbi:MAG: four helix bundle protein [Bacteroidia bacterium]
MITESSTLKTKSYQLALRVIRVYKFLAEERKEFVLSKQLLRSGTSVGANIREAQNAQSNADFIHKLAIAQKECDETMYWLELLHDSQFLKTNEFDSIYQEAAENLKMLRSAIMTSKKKSNNL